jgi:predicted RND superfamily exporter protein
MLRLDRLADLFARCRPAIAVFLILATLLAAVGITKLGFDDVPRRVYQTQSDEFQTLDEFFDDFGSDESDCLLVLESDDFFTPEAVGTLLRLVADVGAIDGIAAVYSMDDVRTFEASTLPFGRKLLPELDADAAAFEHAHRTALAHPMVRGHVLSEDGHTQLVVVKLDSTRDRIDQIALLVEEISQVAQQSTVDSSVSVRLTGIPPIRVEIYGAVKRDAVKFTIIGALLSVLTAIALFRRLWPALVVSGAGALGAVWTLGAMGWAGEKLNVINVVLPTLIIVVGLTDAVHLMTDIRRSLAAGRTPLEASKDALRHLGLACMMTSVTTAVGFGSLVVAEAEIIKYFGLACAVGALFTMVAVLTTVPLLCSTSLGRYMQAKGDSAKSLLPRHVAGALIDRVIARAPLVTTAGIVVTMLLATSTLWLKPDSLLTETIPDSNTSFQALRHCDEHMGGSLVTFVLVEWDTSLPENSAAVIEAIKRTQQVFKDNSDTQYPLSIVNVAQSLPETFGSLDVRLRMLLSVTEEEKELLGGSLKELLDRLLAPQSRRAIVSARVRDVGSAHHQKMLKSLRTELADIEADCDGVSLRLTGTVAAATGSIDQMIVDLAWSLSLAAAVIFGMMTLVFRSFRFGLLSLLPNVFPLVVTSTVMVIAGIPLQLTTVIVFTICLGIAVDDTIHFLNRFQRELAEDGDVPAASRRAFLAVGRALVMTTLILLAGFGSVMLSEMPSSRLFAWLSCTAIASALIGDLIILPAMVAWMIRGERHSVTEAAGSDRIHAVDGSN